MEIAIALLIGFTLGLLVYRQGVKDGQQLKRDLPITPIVKSPIVAINEVKEAKEKAYIDEGIANLMAYDGTEQK